MEVNGMLLKLQVHENETHTLNAVRTHLQNTYADELETIGINAADLAESLMME